MSDTPIAATPLPSLMRDPAAPVSGVLYYNVNGEPRVRPSAILNGGRVRHGQFRYTGNLTVSPTDPWREIIENYGGGGAIDLTPGIYDLGGVAMTIQNGTNITIRSTFPIGAAIRNGRIDINSGNNTLTNIRFEAPATGGGMFNLRGGLTQMVDCDVDGTLSTADSVIQMTGAQLNLRASLRDSIFTIGPSVIQQMIDADMGSAIKIIGSALIQGDSGKWVKCVFAPGTKGKSFLTLDTSKAFVSSLWIKGNPDASGSGIAVRRLSTCTFAAANKFELLAQGIVASNGSVSINKETRFLSCKLPLRGEYIFSIMGPPEAELTDPLAPNGPQFFRDLTPVGYSYYTGDQS